MTEEQILDFLLKNKGSLFEIKIYKPTRTKQQLKYYRGVLVKIISDRTGFTPLEVNEQNKILFGKTTFTDLDTKEFEIIMSLIREFYFYHLNLNIPLPNENFNI